MYYNLDWDKVIELIFEKNLAWMVAGLNGDWDNTVGTILKNGKPVLLEEIEPTFYSSSTWAIPAIEYYDEEKKEIVHENCFFKDTAKHRDPDKPWPEPYLSTFWEKKLSEKEKEKPMITLDERAESTEKNSKNHVEEIPTEYVVSFNNSIKAIKTHSTAIVDELERLFRLIPKEKITKKGVDDLMRAVTPLVKKLLGILDEFAEIGTINSLKTSKENKESEVEFLERVFKTAPKIFKKVMEEKEQKNFSEETEKEIFEFTERATEFIYSFRNLLNGYFIWKVASAFEVAPDELKGFIGSEEFN